MNNNDLGFMKETLEDVETARNGVREMLDKANQTYMNLSNIYWRLNETYTRARNIRLEADQEYYNAAFRGLTAPERYWASQGKNIPAIKFIRGRTGLSLKDAKDIYEKYRDNPGPDEDISPGDPPVVYPY